MKKLNGKLVFTQYCFLCGGKGTDETGAICEMCEGQRKLRMTATQIEYEPAPDWVFGAILPAPKVEEKE